MDRKETGAWGKGASMSVFSTEFRLPPNQTIESLNSRIQEIDRQLEESVSQADRVDYALAAGSGLLCGALDSILFSHISAGPDGVRIPREQLGTILCSAAKQMGARLPEENRNEYAARFITQKLAPSFRRRAAETAGSFASMLDFDNLQHYPGLLGIVSAVMVQVKKLELFTFENGQININLSRCSNGYLSKVIVSLVCCGMLRWLIDMAEHPEHLEEDSELPRAVKDLINQLGSNAGLLKALSLGLDHYEKNVRNAERSLPRRQKTVRIDLGEELKKLAASMGRYLDAAPEEAVRIGGTKGQAGPDSGILEQIFTPEHLLKQSIPVLVNELIVRTFYMVRRLAMQAQELGDIRKIDWRKAVPTRSRTLDRMIAVASMTFTAADTLDAAGRAALESCANYVIFLMRFTCRFNYVGAARTVAALAVEISDEEREAEILRERRILMEERSEAFIEAVAAYREDMERQFCSFMTEDLETILTGMDEIEQGLVQGDSDLVIKGNVRITEQFGGEVQWRSQEEFDDFMDSDETFIL